MGKSNFAAESDKHWLSQVIPVNINSDKSSWRRGPLIWCNENGTLPLLPPQTHNSFNPKKNNLQIPKALAKKLS